MEASDVIETVEKVASPPESGVRVIQTIRVGIPLRVGDKLITLRRKPGRRSRLRIEVSDASPNAPPRPL